MKVPKAERLPSGTWRIRMRLGGESISINAATERECLKKAELVKAEYRNDARLSRSDATLRSAIDEYLSNKSSVLSPSTVRGYRGIQRNRFQRYADVPMGKVNWQRAINEEVKSVSAKTIANSWGLVVTLLKQNGVPIPSVTLPQKICNEHPWLTPEQIPVFLEAIKDDRAELPALLALHGLRRSEIYALSASSFSDGKILVRGSVVFNEQETTVLKKENKNTSSRRDVPILIPRLQELLNAEPVFFEVPISYLTKAINNICEENDLPLVGTHGLRHSFASLCYHSGLSERQTMLLGGWSDPGTMRKIYTHISQSDMAEASDKLRSFFS